MAEGNVSDLIKRARANVRQLVALEMRKQAFNPMDVAGAAPPPGAAAPMPPGGAPPMDPSMAGGAPPMDPSMAGGAPPMDPSMMGDPAMGGGGEAMPPIQMSAQDLMAMMQQMGGGAGGAPNEPAKGTGGKQQALDAKLTQLEGKIDSLLNRINVLVGIFGGQSGMPLDELLGDAASQPPSMGAGEAPTTPAAAEEIPQPKAAAEEPRKRSEAERLRGLVGNLVS